MNAIESNNLRKQKQRRYKNRIIRLLITAGFSLLGIAGFILFGHKYNQEYIGIISLLLIGTFPFYIYLLSYNWKSKSKFQNIIIILLALSLIIVFILSSLWLKSKYHETQLEKYAKVAYGKIIGFDMTTGKGGPKYYAIFEYEFNGKLYHQSISNNDTFWKLDNKLKLLVSEKDPEIFKVIGYKNNNKQNE
jgi:hypothetical protein